MPEPRKSRDVGASVRARLLALARRQGQALDLLLTRYAIERLLHRLSISKHRDRFVLKGAMLMTAWFDDPHRPTRDVDFLGYGDPSPEPMLATFREICAIHAARSTRKRACGWWSSFGSGWVMISDESVQRHWAAAAVA